MPMLYLSPSLQEYNKDVFGNTEEQNMNNFYYNQFYFLLYYVMRRL